MELQQRSKHTALVFTAHPKLHGFLWSLPPSINNMHAFKALQRQPFHRAKQKLHPVLTVVITRLQRRDGSQDGNHSRCRSHRHISGNTDTISRNNKVWVCYRVASQQLNLYFSGRKIDSSCKRSGLRRATRRTSTYLRGLRRCI